MSNPTLDNQLCAALYTASNHLTGVYRALLEEHNLTYPQFLVLLALWEEENISISELGRRLHLGKSTMTPLVKRLEDKALIERTDGADARVKNVVLTAEGRVLQAHASKSTGDAFCSTGLAKAEAKTIIDLCHKLLSSAE